MSDIENEVEQVAEEVAQESFTAALAVAHGALGLLERCANEIGEGNAAALLASLDRQLQSLPLAFHDIPLTHGAVDEGIIRAGNLRARKQSLLDEQQRQIEGTLPSVVTPSTLPKV